MEHKVACAGISKVKDEREARDVRKCAFIIIANNNLHHSTHTTQHTQLTTLDRKPKNEAQTRGWKCCDALQCFSSSLARRRTPQQQKKKKKKKEERKKEERGKGERPAHFHLTTQSPSTVFLPHLLSLTLSLSLSLSKCVCTLETFPMTLTSGNWRTSSPSLAGVATLCFVVALFDSLSHCLSEC